MLIKFIFGIIVIWIFYAFTTSPDGLVVNEYGKIEGVTNNLRAVIKGDSFWKVQLFLAQSELDEALSLPADMQKQAREITQSDREFEQDQRAFYRENPDLMPSVSERQADALRDTADKIEEKAIYKDLLKFNEEEIRSIRNSMDYIQKKLKTTQ